MKFDDIRTLLEQRYSDAVIQRGFALAADSAKLRHEGLAVYRAKSRGSTTYRTQVLSGRGGDDGIPYVTCSCPNGVQRGGSPTCYHSAAALFAELSRLD